MLSVRDASDSLPSSSSAYELYFNDRDEPTVRNLTREGRASGQLSLPSAFEKRDKISRRPTPSIVLSADVRHDTLEDLLRAKYGFRDADPLQTTTEMLPPMKQSMSAPTYYRGQSEISDAMLRQIDAYRSNDDYNSTIAKDDPDDPSLSFRKRENTSDVKQDLFSSKSHSAEVQMSSGSTPYVFESEGERAMRKAMERKARIERAKASAGKCCCSLTLLRSYHNRILAASREETWSSPSAPTHSQDGRVVETEPSTESLPSQGHARASPQSHYSSSHTYPSAYAEAQVTPSSYSRFVPSSPGNGREYASPQISSPPSSRPQDGKNRLAQASPHVQSIEMGRLDTEHYQSSQIPRAENKRSTCCVIY